MQSRLLEQIPRFGWDKKTLIDDFVIGDGGGVDPTVTDPVRRPPGLFQAAVQLTVPGGSSGGVGEFGAVLEGSNTGDGTNDGEWFPIASLDISNAFVAPDVADQFRLLGAAMPFGSGLSFNGSSGNVNLGRFAYLRMKSEVKVGTITVLAFPTTAPGSTITINSSLVLTPAGGPRTPGNDDYDNTLGSTAAIAAEIMAALNDVLNSFRDEILVSSISGSTLTVIPQTSNGFSGFTMTSGLPAEIEVGPTFPMTVRMTGTAGDGESFVREINVVSASGEPNAQTSTFVERPAGTRYLTATSKLLSAVWSPANASGFVVSIEGAVDRESADAGNFVTLATESDLSVSSNGPPATGSAALFNPTGGLVIDMGPFNFFRAVVANSPSLPVPTDVTDYRILFSFAFDDNDWLNGEQGLSELSSTLQSQFIQVRWGTPEPQVGTTVTGQFVDFNGVPLQPGSLRRVFIVCSSDFFGKVNQPHPTATIDSAFRVGGAANTTRIVVASFTDFTVVVDSNAAPTTAYLSADYYVDAPQSTLFPYMLISSEVASIVLT